MKLTKINATFERMRNGKMRVIIADGRASKVSPFFTRAIFDGIGHATSFAREMIISRFYAEEDAKKAHIEEINK